jgi:hypothetical protein
VARTVESVTFPEDWPAFSQKLREALTDERGFQWFQKRCLHKSGRIVYTESSASLIRNRNGEPQYFVGEVLDITKPKEAEEALSDMTRKLVEAQEQERARELTGYFFINLASNGFRQSATRALSITLGSSHKS